MIICAITLLLNPVLQGPSIPEKDLHSVCIVSRAPEDWTEVSGSGVIVGLDHGMLSIATARHNVFQAGAKNQRVKIWFYGSETPVPIREDFVLDLGFKADLAVLQIPISLMPNDCPTDFKTKLFSNVSSIPDWVPDTNETIRGIGVFRRKKMPTERREIRGKFLKFESSLLPDLKNQPEISSFLVRAKGIHGGFSGGPVWGPGDNFLGIILSVEQEKGVSQFRGLSAKTIASLMGGHPRSPAFSFSQNLILNSLRLAEREKIGLGVFWADADGIHVFQWEAIFLSVPDEGNSSSFIGLNVAHGAASRTFELIPTANGLLLKNSLTGGAHGSGKRHKTLWASTYDRRGNSEVMFHLAEKQDFPGFLILERRTGKGLNYILLPRTNADLLAVTLLADPEPFESSRYEDNGYEVETLSHKVSSKYLRVKGALPHFPILLPGNSGNNIEDFIQVILPQNTQLWGGQFRCHLVLSDHIVNDGDSLMNARKARVRITTINEKGESAPTNRLLEKEMDIEVNLPAGTQSLRIDIVPTKESLRGTGRAFIYLENARIINNG